MKNFICACLLALVAVGAAAQDKNNPQKGAAPASSKPWTDAECFSNAKAWFHAFGEGEGKKLSQDVLADRMKSMSDCEGRKTMSCPDQWYVLQAESAYMSEIIVRQRHYLERHKLWQQFVDEDATVKR